MASNRKITVTRGPAGRATAIGVYDGRCGICQRAVRTMSWLNWLGAVEFFDFRDGAALAERFPDLDPGDCERDFHAVLADGRIERGFAAYRWLAWRMPPLWLVAWLMYVPPVPWIGRRIYRRVADGRAIQGCGTDSCPVQLPDSQATSGVDAR